MAINNVPAASGPSASMSMENQLMDFYLTSLKDFSNIWLNGDGSLVKIELQFHFLMQTVPSKAIRDKIWAARKQYEKELQASGCSNAYESSCMLAVSTIMEFLASTFDLMHEDILGPATSKQYRDAVLVIPDMQPVVAPIAEPEPIVSPTHPEPIPIMEA